MPNIALIGAGSVVFAQKLISDILQRDGIGTPEFRLMDIDAERLRIAGIAAEKTARALDKPAGHPHHSGPTGGDPGRQLRDLLRTDR